MLSMMANGCRVKVRRRGQTCSQPMFNGRVGTITRTLLSDDGCFDLHLRMQDLDGVTATAIVPESSCVPAAACHTCGQTGFHSTCSRCRKVWYCSQDCQAKDWKQGHKVVCHAPATCAICDTATFPLPIHSGCACNRAAHVACTTLAATIAGACKPELGTNWYTCSECSHVHGGEMGLALARLAWQRITAGTLPLGDTDRLACQDALLAALSVCDWNGLDLHGPLAIADVAFLEVVLRDTLSRRERDPNQVLGAEYVLRLNVALAALLAEQGRHTQAEAICRASTDKIAQVAAWPGHELRLWNASILATALTRQLKFCAAESVLALANTRGDVGGSASSPHAAVTAASRCSFLECIPAELMAPILKRLDLRGLCCLAGSSKFMQNCVYVQEERLWRRIDFGSWPLRPLKVAADGTGNYLAHLTDDALAAILQRCNARDTTTFISLRNCTGLRGPGLEPLRSSRVLEEIDLRTERRHLSTPGPASLNNDAVVKILKTMLRGPTADSPAAVVLANVHVRRQRFGDRSMQMWDFRNSHSTLQYDEPVRGLMTELARVLLLQVVDNKAACGHCDDLIVGPDTELPKLLLMDRSTLSPCKSCKKHTCQRFRAGSACPESLACMQCSAVECGKCAMLYSCSECSGYFCFNCAIMGYCAMCDMGFCSNCRFVSVCTKCDKSHCDTCDYMPTCDKCYKSVCDDCDYMPMCDKCYKSVCDDCDYMPTCDKCYTSVCDDCDCDFMEQCPGPCGSTYCAKCMPEDSPCITCTTA